MRTSKPITVTLGKQQASVDSRLASGAYESASEVVRAALRALDREEEMLNKALRSKIQEALDDPRSDVSAESVAQRLKQLYSEYPKANPSHSLWRTRRSRDVGTIEPAFQAATFPIPPTLPSRPPRLR
jgi:antitoxin ParD1/3/4